MSRETVIRRIVKRESQKRGLTEEVVRRESPALHRSACEEFGTWNTALKYAGVGILRLYVRECYTRECVIQKIRAYGEKGSKPTATSVISHDRRLYDAARRHFGGWRRALMAAGIIVVAPSSSGRRQTWSRQRVIEHILLRQQAGKPLTFRRVQKDQGALLWAAIRHFGSWNDALAAAGVTAEPRTKQ